MTIFDEIVDTNNRLKRVQEKLEFIEMEADTPRSTVYSDMPKGGGGNAGNPLEQYMIRKEELLDRYEKLKKRLESQWEKAIFQMNAAGIDEQTRKMMILRFASGMRWEKCAEKMSSLYPENKWNVNKCFRKYREVLCKVRKN